MPWFSIIWLVKAVIASDLLDPAAALRLLRRLSRLRLSLGESFRRAGDQRERRNGQRRSGQCRQARMSAANPHVMNPPEMRRSTTHDSQRPNEPATGRIRTNPLIAEGCHDGYFRKGRLP
jgi:hypothetical protein